MPALRCATHTYFVCACVRCSCNRLCATGVRRLQQQYLLPTPNGLVAVPSSVAGPGVNPAVMAFLASQAAQAQGGSPLLNQLAIAQLQQLAQLNAAAAANGVPGLMQPGGAGGAQNAGGAGPPNDLAAATYTAQLMAAAAAASGRPALLPGAAALMANGGGENGPANGGPTGGGDGNQLLTPNYLYTLQALQQMQQAQAAGGQMGPGLGLTLNPQLNSMQLAAMYQAQAAAHAASLQDRM